MPINKFTQKFLKTKINKAEEEFSERDFARKHNNTIYVVLSYPEVGIQDTSLIDRVMGHYYYFLLICFLGVFCTVCAL